MKYSFVALTLGVTAVVGQSIIPGLPTCATSCLTEGLASTGCDIIDFKCSCSNEAFVTGSAACISEACSEEDAQKALTVASELCAKAGAPFPSDILEPPAESTTAEASVTSVSPTESTYPTETETEEPSVTSTPTGTGTGAPVPPTNGTSPTNTNPPPPPAETGAAAKLGVSLGALGVAIVGALIM